MKVEFCDNSADNLTVYNYNQYYREIIFTFINLSPHLHESVDTSVPYTHSCLLIDIA